MADPKVAVFFYGSYMNPAVLKEAGLAPERFEVARLSRFEIEIQPLANLAPSDRGCAYGLLTLATHTEFERLYAHAREVLGGTTCRARLSSKYEAVGSNQRCATSLHPLSHGLLLTSTSIE